MFIYAQDLDIEDRDETRRLLDQVQSNIPAFSWMGVTDADGKHQLSFHESLS